MPRVVTVLCHGTNYHRHKTGELVAEFGRRLFGREIVAEGIGSGDDLQGDFIINEGPGSDSGKADAATPGTVNPLLEIRKGKLAKRVDRRKIRNAAAAEVAKLNAAVRRRRPHYETLADVAIGEAAILALPRSLAEDYVACVREMADMLEFGPADDLSDLLRHLRPGAAAGNLIEQRTQFALEFYGEGLRNPWALEGSATGTGWDDNVHKTVGRIANLAVLPEVVNLLGWSRGGITCFKIANKLAEVFPGIKVNIFAVDPVYGGLEGGLGFDVSNVPETVQEMVVVLAMHERRRMFRPQTRELFRINYGKTVATFLPMPGSHDEQVEWSTGAPAHVTWHLAYVKLAGWGTRFSSPPAPMLSGREVCRRYADMSLKLGKYGTGGVTNWVIGAGFSDRNLPSDPSLPSGYFFNTHHWKCFQGQFPFAAKLFLRGITAQKPLEEELKNEPLIRKSIEAYLKSQQPVTGLLSFVRSRL
jgi:hypothetical protein